MLRTAAVALVLLVLAAGCGGGGGAKSATHTTAKHKGPLSEQEREAEEQKAVPGARLSAADRVAYYQIATTSGLLRARAASVLSGKRGTPRSVLAAGRGRLKLVHPTSAALQALRGQLSSAIDALLRDESHSAAKTAMRATDRINTGLNRYSKGKAVRVLVPD